MIMTVTEIRLQTLRIWIMQQTLIFRMHLRQSMLVDTEKNLEKKDINLLVRRMLCRKILNCCPILIFESEKIVDGSDSEKGV